MLGLVNSPNDISLLRANQSQAKFKSAVGRNLLQNCMNLTIIIVSWHRIVVALGSGVLIFKTFG